MTNRTIIIRTASFLFSFFCFLTGFTQEIITVSPNGPYYTLEQAYNVIHVDANNKITQSYRIEISGDEINLLNEDNAPFPPPLTTNNNTPPNKRSIIWEKSGTENFSITITSKEGTVINKPYSHRVAILL